VFLGYLQELCFISHKLIFPDPVPKHFYINRNAIIIESIFELTNFNRQ